MKLKKLTLWNYRQHRDLETEFDGHLIALTGANGKGKSNFIGGIQYALTGEQPPFKKSDLVSWGQDDGFARLEFEALGEKCCIRRAIKKPQVELTVGGEATTGAKKVDEAINSLLGIDRELFKQVVFVHQAELDSILFEEPRQRELAFQKLMGIGDADRVYKSLGEVLTQFGKADFDEQLTEQKGRLEDAEKIVAASEEAVRDLEAAIAQSPDEAASRKAYQDCETELRRWMELERSYLTWDKAISDLSRLASVSPAPELDGIDEQALQDERANLVFRIQEKKAYDELVATHLGIRDKLRELLPKERECLSDEEIAQQEQQVADLKARAINAHGQADALSKFVVDGDAHVCPLCGSHTEEDMAEKIRERIAELRVDELDKESDEFAVQFALAAQKKMKFKKAIDDLLAQDEHIVADISKRDQTLKDVDLAAMETRRDEIAGLLSRYRAHMAATKKYADQKAYLTKTAQQAQEKLQGMAIEDIRGRKSELEAQKTSIWDQLSRIGRLNSDLAKYKGEVTGARRLIDSLREYIRKLEEDKKSNELIMERVEVIQNVRNWFHYSNGPRTISTAVMQRLNEDVNRFLGEFTAPFTVEPLTEGVGFKVRFTDGRDMPEELPDASVLSGGQKVQLAVAFRLATYCTFASKLGLLVLDEPTAYLDDANIECFGELMAKISRIARNLNVQIIVATHEKQLSGVFDQTIEL